jgi:hypothetical protein
MRRSRRCKFLPGTNVQYSTGNGYDVLSLQRSLTRFDPNTFRRFQQSQCHDPVAERIVALYKLQSADPNSQKKDKRKSELEAHANTKEGARSPEKARSGNPKVDKAIALPIKDGKSDQSLYEVFPSKSLRRRLWDAIAEKKCPRCNGPHLRMACPKPRQGWEDDFEKPDFFTKSPPPKDQVHVQLEGNRNLQAAGVLIVICPTERCLVDTCSDVSLARNDVLTNVRFVADPVVVGYLGGETLLRTSRITPTRSHGRGRWYCTKRRLLSRPRTAPGRSGSAHRSRRHQAA